MAAFTEIDDGAQSDSNSNTKWKPGGRGRPPKSTKPPATLPGKFDSITQDIPEPGEGVGGDDAGQYAHRPGAPVPPDAYTLRRNPATYPRRENGLPIPLYRVTRTEDDLHNYLAAMRPEDWGHCEMYVYKYYPRAKPIPGEPSYIDKISQGPVDLLKFIETYGSGVYGFTLNDANVQGNRRTAMYAKLELSRDHIPEMYDLETLDIDHKHNRQLVARLQRDGILDNKGEKMANDTAGMAQVVDKLTNALLEANKNNNRPAPAPAPDPNAQAMAQVQAKTIEMLGDANKAALTAATAGNKSGGMDETLKLMTTLMGFMKPPDTSPMLALMMEELKSNREATKQAAEAAEKERQRNHELQMKALEQKATAADPLAQVETFMKIKDIFGGGGEPSQPRNWKEQGLAMLGEHLPQILNVGAALVQNIGRPNPVTAGMVGGQGQPQTIDAQPLAPALNPGMVAQPAQAQAPASSAAGANGEPNPAADPNLTPEQRLQIQRIQVLQNQLMEHGGFLVKAIKKGQTGYQFAEFLIAGTDELTYARARGYSRDEWLTAIFSFPQLQQEFAGAEATVAQFIEEFLDFGNGEDDGDGDGDGDDDDNTPPAPKSTPGKPQPPAPTPITAGGPNAQAPSRSRTGKGKV